MPFPPMSTLWEEGSRAEDRPPHVRSPSEAVLFAKLPFRRGVLDIDQGSRRLGTLCRSCEQDT